MVRQTTYFPSLLRIYFFKYFFFDKGARMRTRQSQTQHVRKDKEEEDEYDPIPSSPPKNSNKPDIVFDFGFPKETIRSVAQISAPGTSWVFWVGFAIASYFHESYFSQVVIILGAWFAVQVAAGILDDDFKNDLFWSIFSMVAYLIGYLFAGSFYSLAKLWWEVSRGHLSAATIENIRQCKIVANTTVEAMSCTSPIFTENGWLLMRWMTTWPISLTHTLFDNPIHTLATLIYTSLRMRYIRVMFSAIDVLDARTTGGDPLTWSIVAIYFAYFLGYLLVGYAWAHAKLFIDVWQGSFSPSLDQQVRDAYERKIGYWAFVKQIKWHVTSWMIVWPFSIFYTLLRHPLRILVDFVYELSQRKLAWIVEMAMFWRMKKD